MLQKCARGSSASELVGVPDTFPFLQRERCAPRQLRTLRLLKVRPMGWQELIRLSPNPLNDQTCTQLFPADTGAATR